MATLWMLTSCEAEEHSKVEHLLDAGWEPFAVNGDGNFGLTKIWFKKTRG